MPTAITVELLDETEILEQKLASGDYPDASAVVRAGLRALREEDGAFAVEARRKIAEALADPRPSISAEDVFAQLERRYAADAS